MSKITNVVIVGGTHGNEKTGVNLIRHLKNDWMNPYHSFEISFVEGNPKAIVNNLRYIDHDLNRSFNETLNDSVYEKQRVLELHAEVKNPETTFVIDLHTTTSNMGVTWIFSKKDLLSRQIGYRAAGGINHSYILETVTLDQDTHYVNQMAKHGIMIEVGPIAQNLAVAKTYNDTKSALLLVLEGIEVYNKTGRVDYSFKLPYFYKEMGSIDYPRDEKGNIIAMIHPDLQGQDYQQLAEKHAFLTFTGKSLGAEEVKRYYPIFVNEAAYYEKGIAFSYTDKRPIKHFFGE
ncbi:MAG: aspartoacylase [Bdellovibrionales bacterium]|nr:aspartoacylase [Bdellovibrionales bacterium]